jgi:phosphocarrier protein HPr
MSEIVSGELCNIAVIGNQRGLHARAAAKFVKIAESFEADIAIMKDEMRVSARSIMGLMMLTASQGAQIKICASGSDAADAVATLSDFVKRKFDEE